MTVSVQYTRRLNQKTSHNKTFVVADVHGCYALMMEAIAYGRSINAHTVLLGDLYDRGPENEKCFFFWLNEMINPSSDLTCLLGNHEQILLNCLFDDFNKNAPALIPESNGTHWYSQYGSDTFPLSRQFLAKSIVRMAQNTLPTLRINQFVDQMNTLKKRWNNHQLPLWHRDNALLCVHAGLPDDWKTLTPDLNNYLIRQHHESHSHPHSNSFLWNRPHYATRTNQHHFQDHDGSYVTIAHGHTPKSTGETMITHPDMLGQQFNFDGKAYRTGILECGLFDGDKLTKIHIT